MSAVKLEQMPAHIAFVNVEHHEAREASSGLDEAPLRILTREAMRHVRTGEGTQEDPRAFIEEFALPGSSH